MLSLDKLPRKIQCAYYEMCKIAFTGARENKVTFSHSDLEAVKESTIICEMGLLQAMPSVISDGTIVYYHFIHLSIQEYLSALYIARLPASEQMSTFNSLFSDSRFSAVFQFYSAITKLRSSRPLLSKLPQWLIPQSVTVHMRDLIGRMIQQRNKLLLVSLLHCLAEAEDPSLFQFVIEQLNNRLNVENTSLTPVDCLAVGYFISAVSLTTTKVKEFKVNLTSCSLRDAGIKSLMRSISRHINPHCTVNTHMWLMGNDIREEGASHVADLLNSTSIVSKLWLYNNPVGDKGLQTIFNALKQNKTLKYLDIGRCGMTDTGIASLADALKSNNTLEELHIDDNDEITDKGLTCLTEVLSSSSALVELVIPEHLAVDEVKKTINEARQRSGLAAIHVIGMF